VEILAQMFTTYAQEAGEERLRGYLSIIEPVPLAALSEAVRSAMAMSGQWPPGPGEIVAAWKASRATRHAEERPYAAPQARAQLRSIAGGYGQVVAAIESRIEPSGHKVLERARVLRTEKPEMFPAHPLRRHILSTIAAAVELGMSWPLSRDFEKSLDQEMLDAKDRTWWDSDERHKLTCTP
jgi:hypothetical protein